MQKVVLITGASKGIGKAIALKFAKNGHKVIINYKNDTDYLLNTLNLLKQTTDDFLHIKADVGIYEDCLDMYKQIIKKYGKLDILINNAGISYVGLFNKMSPIDWQNLIKTNIEGVINLSHIVSQDMIKQKNGNIINISSVWGDVGASCEAVYSATKGAVNSFTKALAKELAPSDIRINAIACGVIDTQMNSFLTKNEKETLAMQIPLGRFGKTEEVADLALFLASNNSSYLTGQIITLDGAFV